MNRRKFFGQGAIAALGLSLTSFDQAPEGGGWLSGKKRRRKAKNIIFLVSDGMSTGTLNMADLLLQQKEGRMSQWMQLYRQERVVRALMDTASANSLVTDSAAASSSWGGGVRVNNGALNVGPNGENHRPILQKFKAAGKSVGCVTTVPITHATPAGFCINSESRGSMDEIALKYLPLRFDVMMGGGAEVFSKDKRKDQRDLFQEFAQQGYQVARTRQEMLAAQTGSPVLGVFYDSGLPYTVDRNNDRELQAQVPTLAEMTSTAIRLMQDNPEGFVMQVEGGKVDWAAHGNDVAGLLYDQLAFDEAIKVAIDFAEQRHDTLVIITTDHGNANPGLFYGSGANANFAKLHHFKHSNDWVLQGITPSFSVAQVIERVEAAQGIVLKPEEAQVLLSFYKTTTEEGVYNPRNLPFEKLAQFQRPHTSVSWAGMDHSADFVELAMLGPGSELLKPFVKNIELHPLMLQATQVEG